MSEFLYCLNSSTIRPTPILEKIRIARQAGYGAIELWHDDIELHVTQGGTVADIRHAVQDQGLVVPTTISVKGWFETTGAEHQVALEKCKRRMAQAVEIGAIHIICGPPSGRANKEVGARNYRALVELGISMGVKPALEFLGFVEELNTIESALEVLNQAGHPGGSVVLDPFHIFRGGGSPASIAKVKGEQIAIFHFNDTPATPSRLEQHDHNRVYPGDGHLDLQRQLDLLRQVGYRKWLSLELFREDLWGMNPLNVACTGLDKMRAIAER